MPVCFVIQPFDGGKFDKRYKGTFKPAIEAADLEAYRVDQDPATAIPIDEIEAGIRGADVCFADITLDNPNVWFELGFAIAERKPIVMVCADERTSRYPFDVQHRNVSRYKTESAQDYAAVAETITSRFKALLTKQSKLEAVAQPSSLRPVEGLDQIEIMTLVAVAENVDGPDDFAATQVVRQDMERAGFRKVAVTLALRVLLDKEMLEAGEVGGFNDTWTGYQLRPKGYKWLMDHKDLLALRVEDPDDDEIPF